MHYQIYVGEICGRPLPKCPYSKPHNCLYKQRRSQANGPQAVKDRPNKYAAHFKTHIGTRDLSPCPTQKRRVSYFRRIDSSLLMTKAISSMPCYQCMLSKVRLISLRNCSVLTVFLFGRSEMTAKSLVIIPASIVLREAASN